MRIARFLPVVCGLLLLASLVAAAPICQAPAGARCWYIAPNGSDTTGTGSFTNPYASSQYAIKNISPGDIIYLRGGTYTQANSYAWSAVSWSDSSKGVRQSFAHFGRVSLPGWATSTGKDENWNPPATGTKQAPIIMEPYPGEKPILYFTGGIGIAGADVQSRGGFPGAA